MHRLYLEHYRATHGNCNATVRFNRPVIPPRPE